MNIGYIFIVYLNMPFRWCITHADPLTRSKLELYMAAIGSPSNLHRNTIDGATGSL